MALAFATSYIPTTSAQVTRASDNASMTGTNFSSWYNIAQGTMFVNLITKTWANNQRVLTLSGGSGTTLTIDIKFSAVYLAYSNGTSTSVLTTPTNNTEYKVAISFVSGSYKASTNGGSIVSTTDTLVNQATSLSIG